MGYLYQKTVIVTGASQGIGYELSERLIQKYDCKVIAVARNLEKLNKAKDALGENYYTFSCDVSKIEDWQKLADFIKESNLKPQILINNAGMMLPFSKAENCSLDDYERIIKTNFISLLYSLKTIVPLLSGDKGLVNISSSSSLCPVVGQSGYCATKSAVKSFTEVLQTEADFYVSLIMPGFCRTNIMSSIVTSEKEKKLVDKISMPADKCATKILKAINKKRRRKIIGVDARLMHIMYKLFPRSAGKIIAKVLKKSHLKLFDKIQ